MEMAPKLEAVASLSGDFLAVGCESFGDCCSFLTSRRGWTPSCWVIEVVRDFSTRTGKAKAAKGARFAGTNMGESKPNSYIDSKHTKSLMKSDESVEFSGCLFVQWCFTCKTSKFSRPWHYLVLPYDAPQKSGSDPSLGPATRTMIQRSHDVFYCMH